MSQSYSSNCFSTANVIETDMQNVENNFDALRSLFSGSSAPTSPDAGQLWYDTGSSSVKIRYNSSWVEWWDMDGQCVAAGQVKTASLAAGALSADAAGRGKMADGYITNAKVSDVDGSKIFANSVTGDRLQNNAITPSKLSAGSGTLLTWSGGPSSLAINSEASLATAITNYRIDGSTFLAFWKGYMYIPSGAKYVILGVRGVASGANAYVRVVVGSTGGSTATLTGNAGYMSAAGWQLDISGEAGGWKLVELQVVGASGSTTGISIVGVTVQWYGA